MLLVACGDPVPEATDLLLCEDALEQRRDTHNSLNNSRATEPGSIPSYLLSGLRSEKDRLSDRLEELDADVAFYCEGKERELTHERAIQDYDEAIRLDTGYVNAYYNRGNAYANLDQYERAIQDFSEAIRLDPGNAEAYYNRGVMYGRIGKTMESERDFRKVKELGLVAP